MCRLKFLITNRHTRAQVVHNSGVVLVSASTTEFEITKHLYKTTDVTAAKNIGRVMAQRCLEAGITRVRWEIKRGDIPKQRVMFTTVFLVILFTVDLHVQITGALADKRLAEFTNSNLGKSFSERSRKKSKIKSSEVFLIES